MRTPRNPPATNQAAKLGGQLEAAVKAHKLGNRMDAALASVAGDIKRSNLIRPDANFSSKLADMVGNSSASPSDKKSLEALKTDIKSLDPATLTGTSAYLAQGDQLAIKDAIKNRDDKGLNSAIKKAASNYASDVGGTVSRDNFATALGRIVGDPPTPADKPDRDFLMKQLFTAFPQKSPFP